MSLDAEAFQERKVSEVKDRQEKHLEKGNTIEHSESDGSIVKENTVSEILKSADKMSPDKDTQFSEIPEHIKRMSAGGMPPINMNELTTILQGPNMPSQKVMKEVADKLKDKENESDDGSACSNDIKGLFDTILEVSLLHSDSEDDVEDDDEDETIPRVVPCAFCKKKFEGTMSLKTHILMTHSQEDPSVLNIQLEVNQSRRGLMRTKRRAKSLSTSSQIMNKAKKHDQAPTDDTIHSKLSTRRQSLEYVTQRKDIIVKDFQQDQKKDEKKKVFVSSPVTAFINPKDIASFKGSSVRSSPRTKKSNCNAVHEEKVVKELNPKQNSKLNVISRNKSEGSSNLSSQLPSKAMKRKLSKDEQVIKTQRGDVELRRSSRRKQN